MIATRAERADRALVEAVRDGDDSAFEELYRRYHPRIAAYVRRMVRDSARAEDLAQDAFFSALRRIRATDSEIAFKPWIFEIARNTAIDHWRRSTRTEEVSVEADEQLRPTDRARLVGGAGPDSELVDKERFEHLRGAFDELSDVHSRILVMRELEGLSYREIGERLDLSRSSVESALFRARRRLESEYADISEGRRCAAMRAVIARMAEGIQDKHDAGRLARHARRCHICRRRARELGVEPLRPRSGLRRRVTALLPLPFAQRGDPAQGGAAAGGQHGGTLFGVLPAGAHVGTAVAERAAAFVAAAVIAGAGGVALGGGDVLGGDGDAEHGPEPEQRAPAPDRQAGKHARGEAAAGSAGERTPGARPGDEQSRAAAARGSTARGKAGAAGGPTRPGGGQVGAGGRVGSGGPLGAGVPALPALPRVPDGGAPSGPSADAPRLPELAPRSPALEEPPAAPDLPAATPPVEPPPSPVEAPAAPELPPLDTADPQDEVAAIGPG